MNGGIRRGVVELEGLTKRYGEDVVAVDDVTLRVGQGELLALLGPSGCGKTTILRLIAGLVSPSSGRIKLDGNDITGWASYRRDMGVVFQSYALFPHLNVDQNVAFGLEMRGVPRRDVKAMVANALEMVRLDGYHKRRIRELSGGQQQRVALARALVIRPKVLLLDEPLSNLDAILREELRHEIRDIQHQLGITTIFVTHDRAEALSMADRVAVMKRGRVVQVGSPTEIYERPGDPFVAEFVGRINSFSAKVIAAPCATAALDLGGAHIRLPRDIEPGQAVLIMIRPQRLHLGPRRDGESPAPTARNGIEGQVRKVIYVGDMVQYRIGTAGPELLFEQSTHTAAARFAVDDAVMVEWDIADTIVFDGREDAVRNLQ